VSDLPTHVLHCSYEEADAIRRVFVKARDAAAEGGVVHNDTRAVLMAHIRETFGDKVHAKLEGTLFTIAISDQVYPRVERLRAADAERAVREVIDTGGHW